MIDFITGPDPPQRFNYIRIMSFYLLPLVVIVLSWIFWLFAGICSRHTRQQRIDKTISSISIIWFLFYPTIVANIASSMNCADIEGTPRLYDDLEEICF